MIPTGNEHQFKLMIPDGKHVKISYEALTPGMGENVNVTNSASIDGVSRTDSRFDESLVVSKIYESAAGTTHELTVEKLDGGDSTKTLDGAEFEFYIVRTKDSTLDHTADIKIGGQTYDCYAAPDWKFTTKDGGTFKLDKNSDWKLEPGNYYILKETKAPAGYALPKEPILIYYGYSDEADKVNYPGAQWVVPEGNLTVYNNAASFELPKSGGIGTTIFYVIGGCLIAAAAVLFALRRRAGKDR